MMMASSETALTENSRLSGKKRFDNRQTDGSQMMKMKLSVVVHIKSYVMATVSNVSNACQVIENRPC